MKLRGKKLAIKNNAVTIPWDCSQKEFDNVVLWLNELGYSNMKWSQGLIDNSKPFGSLAVSKILIPQNQTKGTANK